MYRLAFDRNGRLRICGKHLGSDSGGQRVCYGRPGHSGMHGREGDLIEWLLPKDEYERFSQGEHAKLSD